MKSQISRIKYFNGNQSKIVNLDKDIPINMLVTLYNKFNLNKMDINIFVRNNKNLGVILNLIKKDINYDDNWKQFIDLVFPRKNHINKSDNVIVSKDYRKLLLITNRNSLLQELKNLNKLIFRTNEYIEEHNNKNFEYQTISR